MAVAIDGRRTCDPSPAPRDTAIEHVWRRYKDEGGEVLRTRLVVHYMRTHVRRLAERLHSSLPDQVELDDLIQQGYLGLSDAIERFDLERDVRFETFSSRRIFGAMRDYLRAIDPVPRLMRATLKRLDAAEEAHRKEHGLPPTDDELRELLSMTTDKLQQMRQSGRSGAVVSYQAAQAGADPDDDGDAMESFANPDPATPLTAAEKADLHRWITRGFCRRDHLIITLYYYEQLTMREVGRALGISESRVSQRIDSILKRLKARLSYGGADEEFV